MTHKNLNSVAVTTVICLDLWFVSLGIHLVLNFLTKNLKTKKKYTLWSSCLTTDKRSFQKCKLNNSYQVNSGMQSKHSRKIIKSEYDQLVI